MRKIILLTIAILLILGAAFAMFWPREVDQRLDAAFAGEDCPPTSAREYASGSYTGPLWDTHVHIGAIPDGPVAPTPEMTGGFPVLGVNITVQDVVCTFQTEETERVFMFFPVWEPFEETMIEVARRATELYSNQFVPFIMPPQGDNEPGGYPTVDAATLKEFLAIVPELFQGFGEIGLYARERGAAELPPDSERMLEIYPVLRERGLVVYLHLGSGHEDNLARAANLFPDVQFIFHGDQLVAGDRDNPDLSAIDKLLFEHPNITYGIDELYGDVWLLRPEVSREEFFAHFKDPETLLEYDLRVWRGFIESHPDQIIWGTDRGAEALWTMDRDVGLELTSYARAFIGRLDSAVQEKFAWQNAARLVDAERVGS